MNKLFNIIFSKETLIVVLAFIGAIGLSTTLFPDTESTSLKPLWILVPTIVSLALYFIYAKKK